VQAAEDFAVTAQLAFDHGAATLTRLDGVARSGARASFAADRPISMASGTMPAVAGTASLSGGGLPTATVRFNQSGPQRAISGVATVLPYAGGGARLALDPVRFTVKAVGARIATVATISGPLADGRVDGLRVPIVADRDTAGVLRLGPACITLSFDALAISTLRLRAARLPLCPTGPALIRVAAGKVEGGARVATLRLTGSLGSTPLTLAADDTRVTLGNSSVDARNIAARLGEGASATQLDIGRLLGTVTTAGLGGRFDNAAGRIGKVPLLLSGAGGAWRLERGALALAGTATVADSAPAARFHPLRADGLKLRLAGGTIQASAQLVTPAKAIPVASVVIEHDLGGGTGTATLAVPRLAFTDAFQPDELTPLTFGVVADVRGTVTGDARIGWDARGVTSTGTFATDGLDLAAAFGPVAGLATTIRFTDLLAMESAPGQIATVASINPGIPVTDGRLVFRTLANSRVQVASGHWPFAGGALDLRPTVLDLGGPRERRLTFDLDGVDAGRFLQQFDFGNLSATGTFDGTLPMVFDTTGGRIEGGTLKVRRGGGNIAYVGDLTQKDLGVWGNLAFQALRSIDYRDLAIAMNGPLAGEMITEVRFAGISQGKGARSNFLIRRLQKLPFIFNIRIRAPFRGLIDSAQSFYDPSRLVVRNLLALIQQQNDGTAASSPPHPIQPAARDPSP
jgi:translocation and assembly module TamB